MLALEAGLSFETFWQMSMREFNLVLTAHARTEFKRMRQAWEIARWQTAVLVNKDLKPHDHIHPQKLLPLPGDEAAAPQQTLTGQQLKSLLQRFGKPAQA